ncbi:MAG: 50S ribosomal protein L15 [Candidatus Sericytochromatia bacterium]|nr:50S ribosomal protein L15 [Candidatus Sericytochromatia bacterium]
MRIDELQPAVGAKHRKKIVGRGHATGHGKTSTRGKDGAGSRSGGGVRAGFEGGQMPLFRRTPKKHHFIMPNRKEWAQVNVGSFAELPAGTVVTPELMLERGWIKKLHDGVRVLGTGDLTVSLTVKGHHFTAGAEAKITAAGGTVERL